VFSSDEHFRQLFYFRTEFFGHADWAAYPLDSSKIKKMVIVPLFIILFIKYGLTNQLLCLKALSDKE
jgi:hypothetical protein